MREIKIRAQRKYSEEWNYLNLSEFLTSDVRPQPDMLQYLHRNIGQYTGLKDKNGVEIYEGDILICHEYDGSDCVNKIIQTFKNAVVGFYSGNFYYYPKGNMNQPHQLLMYAYESEVIGNIHEHPELLTQHKN